MQFGLFILTLSFSPRRLKRTLLDIVRKEQRKWTGQLGSKKSGA